MPKLLSRSKHEEFDSNSALHIRDEKEKRAENAENLELQEIPVRTVHLPATVHPIAIVHLLLTLSCFCYNFLFLPILSLLIPFDLGFFVIFPCSKHISASVCTNYQSLHQ